MAGNPAILLLSGNGTLSGEDRFGSLTATGVGALRYVPGKIAGTQAFNVEEPTTNLVGNPWFGTNATGWTGATRTTTYAYQGVASGLISATGANAQATYALTVPATAHRLSAVVRNNAAASRSVQLLYNGVLVGSAVTVLAGAVARFDAAITGTATSVGAGVRIITSVSGETFNIGHLQVEAKAYRTSETPALDAAGTVLSGYAWTGTAHASTSTRTGAQVYTPITSHLNAAKGAMSLWFKPGLASYYGVTFREIIFANGTNDPFVLLSQNNGTVIQWRIGANALTADWTHGKAATNQDWIHFVLEWEAGQVARMYADGLLVASTSGAITEPVFSGNLYLGTAVNVGDDSTIIGPLMTFDRLLTEAERSTLYTATTPWTIGMLADPSRQVVPFSGGPKRLERSMWRATVENLHFADITAKVTGATVSMDIDRTIPSTISVDLIDPTVIRPYADFLAPVVTITEIVSGTSVTSQVGLYRAGLPSMTRHPNAVVGTVGGEDIVSLLVNSGTGSAPLNLAPAANYMAAAVTQCNLAGVTRVRFPTDARTVPTGKFHSWPPGTARCRIVLDIMLILGYLPPWSDHEGYLVTRVVEDPGAQAPARSYVDGDGSDLTGEVQSDPATTTLANHIVVTYDDITAGTTLTADRTNTDPLSPASIPNIGERFRHEAMTQAADQAAVNAYASQLVEQWGNVLMHLSLTTPLDPLRGYWESADVAIHADRAGGGIVGRFRVKGWDHSLTDGTTAVGLRRNEPFGRATGGS